VVLLAALQHGHRPVHQLLSFAHFKPYRAIWRSYGPRGGERLGKYFLQKTWECQLKKPLAFGQRRNRRLTKADVETLLKTTVDGVAYLAKKGCLKPIGHLSRWPTY
jgi:hypothetical protein